VSWPGLRGAGSDPPRPARRAVRRLPRTAPDPPRFRALRGRRGAPAAGRGLPGPRASLGRAPPQRHPSRLPRRRPVSRHV